MTIYIIFRPGPVPPPVRHQDQRLLRPGRPEEAVWPSAPAAGAVPLLQGLQPALLPPPSPPHLPRLLGGTAGAGPEEDHQHQGVLLQAVLQEGQVLPSNLQSRSPGAQTSQGFIKLCSYYYCYYYCLQLKKSFKKVGKAESLKMYTWSPYTSSLFYSDPKMLSSAVLGSAPPLLQAPDGSLQATQDGLQF